MVLTTFFWEEARHIEFFRCLLDELRQAMEHLRTDASPEAQDRASVTYNMIVEGVLAETGYPGYHDVMDQLGIAPGTREGIELVQRDESRHLAYGIYLLSRLVAEGGDPVCDAIEDQMKQLLDCRTRFGSASRRQAGSPARRQGAGSPDLPAGGRAGPAASPAGAPARASPSRGSDGGRHRRCLPVPVRARQAAARHPNRLRRFGITLARPRFATRGLRATPHGERSAAPPLRGRIPPGDAPHPTAGQPGRSSPSARGRRPGAGSRRGLDRNKSGSLALALGVVGEIFEPSDEFPWPVDQDTYVAYAREPFQARRDRRERARDQSLDEVQDVADADVG